MPRELRLSEEVQTYIDVLKNEGDRGKSPEQRREDWKLNKMVEIMIDDIIKSRETITVSRLKKLETLVETSPELIEDFLDDRFTVEAVDGVQSSVKRLIVFYLHLEPDNCFAAAGIWHPDNRALTRVRSAIVGESEQWAAIRKKVELEGDSLARPPRGFDPDHRFIDDLKMKDYVTSIAFSEEEVCSQKFLRDFAVACRKMSPLVEFTTRALGLKY